REQRERRELEREDEAPPEPPERRRRLERLLDLGPEEEAADRAPLPSLSEQMKEDERDREPSESEACRPERSGAEEDEERGRRQRGGEREEERVHAGGALAHAISDRPRTRSTASSTGTSVRTRA